MAKTKHNRPAAPPPPLFLGQPERDLVHQINNEIAERVIGQEIIYYPIDHGATKYHALYGEAIKKTFLPPIRVYALVTWETSATEYAENIGVDKAKQIMVHFHARRLRADQNIEVQVGDFLRYGSTYYEIVKTEEPKLIFGQVDSEKVELTATCQKARRGNFDAT